MAACRNGLSRESTAYHHEQPDRVGSVEYLDKVKQKLDKCRSEREREQEIKRLEEERLHEIIAFCEKYNETFKPNKPTTFSDVISYAQLNHHQRQNGTTTPTKPKVEHNNNTDRPSNGQLNGSKDETLPMLNGTVNRPVDSCKPNENSNTPIAVNGCNGSDAAVGSSTSLDRTDDDADDESESSTLRNTESRASSETLNALMVEKALLQAELEQIQQQQLSDTEDDELREFQKIEREIKLAEVTKCLENIEQQIASRSIAVAETSSNSTATKPTTTNGHHSSTSSIASSSRHSTIGGDEYVKLRPAPLAEAETSDDSGGETLDGDAPEEYSSNTYDILMYSTPINKKKSSSLPPNELHSVQIRGGRGSLQHQRSLQLFIPNGIPGTHDKDGLTKHLLSLGHDLNSYTDYIQITCCTCSGYLWKLCSKSENKWKKRFFHFDRHYRIFFYYKSLRQFKKVKKPNGGVYFDDIRDVYIDRARTKRKYDPADVKGGPLKRKNDGRCVFVVETTDRQYVLSTFVWEVMRIWVDTIFTGAESYFD